MDRTLANSRPAQPHNTGKRSYGVTFGVALLAGLAGGIGDSLLTAAGEAIGRSFSSPTGTITAASPNVFINSRKAARVEKSIGHCEKHPGPVQIAEGSTNVFINGVAAARKDDKLTCGATITSGSGNVTIGGGTYRYLPVDDEVPEWLRTTVDVLMAVAGAAAGIAQLIKAGTQSGMKAIMPCALKFTAGFVVGEVASRYVVKPVARRAIGGLVGNPVDLTTGRKVIPDESTSACPASCPSSGRGFTPATWPSTASWVAAWSCRGSKACIGRMLSSTSPQPGQVISDRERDDLHREVYRTRASSPAALVTTPWAAKPGSSLLPCSPTSCGRCTTKASTPRTWSIMGTTRSTDVTNITHRVRWYAPR